MAARLKKPAQERPILSQPSEIPHRGKVFISLFFMFAQRAQERESEQEREQEERRRRAKFLSAE
jgi:hypothetical protein